MSEAKSISWFLAPNAAWSSPGRISAPFLPLALPGEGQGGGHGEAGMLLGHGWDEQVNKHWGLPSFTLRSHW